MNESAPRTVADIEAEIAELDREIIALESLVTLGGTRDESGSNSLDDDSKEDADQQQRLAAIADQIEQKRRRKAELQGELHALQNS